MATTAARLARGARLEFGPWQRFWIALTVAAAGLVAITAMVGFGVAGTATAAADLGGRVLATMAAAASCANLAYSSTGKVRTAWGLIAGSLTLGLATGASSFGAYAVLLHTPPPFPSVADALLLVAKGLFLAGVLSFPSSPTHTSGRLRLAIDASVIAISMLYVSWAFGLGELFQHQHVGWFTAATAMAYPVTDMVTLTVLLLVIRRAPRAKHGRLGLLAAGLVFELLANASNALNFAAAGRSTSAPWSDVALVTGLVLISLAAWTPAGPAKEPAAETPPTLWRMSMPWLGLVAVLVTVVVVTLTHRTFDQFLIYPSIALAVLLMSSQLESYRETLVAFKRSRSAESALLARTTVLNQVIAHAPLGVARIGFDGRIIDANPRLGELLHASQRVLLGTMISDFIERSDMAQFRERYRALVSGRVETIEEEGAVHRADGTAAWLHWTTTAVRRADGSVEYFLSMVEDMSARHRAEETAMENLAGLERLNKLKSEFVSMVSHEFRTALVGIQGFSELIRDEDLETPDIKGLAGDINNDAQRLNRMIGEMLDLDRMEAGKIRLALKPANLNTLLQESAERARMSTEKHRVTEDLDLALPVISADSDRVVQVASNLLNNAVKYSPNGGEIRITSRLEGDFVHVSVSDEGAGIPEEFLGKVFGRYERFESNSTAKVAGTGLGLAISRQIVELHGGRIWVESEVGQGSTFHFTLPVTARVETAG